MHALKLISFLVDSKLVTEELNGRCACLSHDLVSINESCLVVVVSQNYRCGYEHGVVERVNRECNVGADSLDNVAVYELRVVPAGIHVVVNQN